MLRATSNAPQLHACMRKHLQHVFKRMLVHMLFWEEILTTVVNATTPPLFPLAVGGGGGRSAGQWPISQQSVRVPIRKCLAAGATCMLPDAGVGLQMPYFGFLYRTTATGTTHVTAPPASKN
jgi:hypothetical protein